MANPAPSVTPDPHAELAAALEERPIHPLQTLLGFIRRDGLLAPVAAYALARAREQLPNVTKRDVLFVGDTLRTDIIGSNTYGFDSTLVLSGNTLPETADLMIRAPFSGVLEDDTAETGAEPEPGVRDLGLLESALHRPTTGYYGDLVEMAGALFESLLMNHPFVDGNKRVAFFAVDVFLRLNGYKMLVESKAAHAFLMELFSQGGLAHHREPHGHAH